MGLPHSQGPHSSLSRRRTGIPEATVARLPVYLRVLGGLAESGVTTVSSDALAVAAGVGSAKLRKDLSHLGSYGTRGVGYDVEYLVYQISRTLGLTQHYCVAIIGVGNLGHALANYGGFASRGFRIAALLDTDGSRVGETINGIEVCHVDELDETVRRERVSIGVIATPAGAAQDVCDRLVAAGVTSILNFAPIVLAVPAGVAMTPIETSSSRTTSSRSSKWRTCIPTICSPTRARSASTSPAMRKPRETKPP